MTLVCPRHPAATINDGKPSRAAKRQIVRLQHGRWLASRWQIKRGGGQWCRGKTFDTFAPLGPCLVLRDEIPDPAALKIRTLLNEEVMQDWNTGDMIFSVPKLIAFLSGSTTLLPGTVILTGTPHGVGMARKPQVWLKAGDDVTIEIEKIGALQNPVINEG